MSAFVVGFEHIHALVTFAAQHVHGHCTLRSMVGNPTFPKLNARVAAGEEPADALGRVLWAENTRSVQHRYPGDKAGPGEIHPDLPGPVGFDGPESFVWDATAVPHEALVIIKGCACLDYQSCETDDWKTTEAKHMLDWIQSAAINALPGYSDADGWDIAGRPAGMMLSGLMPKRKR